MLADGAQFIEIVSGIEASRLLRAQPETLRVVLERETDETWEIPRELRFRTRAWLRNVVKSMTDGLSWRLRREVKPLLDWLYPPDWFFPPTHEEEYAWALYDAHNILSEDQFVCACLQGQIVGIFAYKLGGRWHDGRDVYELTKAYVLPPFRRGWLYARLQRRTIELIRASRPEALIMAFSKNPAVIIQLQRLKWAPLSLSDYSAITQKIGRSGMAPEIHACFSHWRAFMWDPLEEP